MKGQCCVRFELNTELGHIYNQPLYYLAENYRQSIIPKELIDAEKFDSNLKINVSENSDINLQMCDFTTDKIIDKTVFRYVIDKICGSIISFTYKDCHFSIKVLEYNNDKPIPMDQRNFTRLSYYEISFLKCDLTVFEQFLKTSTIYYDKFLDESSEDSKQINIYVNQDEGHYFDFITSRKKRSLDTIYLPAADKQAILNDLTKFLLPSTLDRYTKLGLNYKRVYLFEGVPGAGKTSFIIALASHFDYDVAIISFGPKFKDTDMIHLLRNMNSANDGKKQNRKQFLILEDIDCIFKERKSNDEARNMVSFSGLLNALDGMTTPHNLVCFITTNYKNHLDAALIRPGRVDYIMSFDYVVKEQLVGIFPVYMNLTNDDKNLADKFYDAVKELKIKVTFSLVQQYLLKYLDNPTLAIENINEMKLIYNNSVVDKAAEDTGLYS